MSNRYKSSEEFIQKYAREAAQRNAQADAAKTKEQREAEDAALEEWGRQQMLEGQAQQQIDERLLEAERRRLSNESKKRTFDQFSEAKEVGAVAQNNPARTPELTGKEIVPGVYSDPLKKGVYYGADGKILSELEAQEKIQKRIREEVISDQETQKTKEQLREKSPNPDPLKKYLRNTQALLFNKMVEKFGSDENVDFSGPEKIYRVPENVAKGGSFTQRLSTEELFSPTEGVFLQATPAQLGSLVPLMRFFIVDKDGYQQEIYFSDKTSPGHIKALAELKGKSIEDIITYNARGGGEAGIKSFTWNYNNKHEGDYIIEADLELYFGTLVELANDEYLKFLFPTGEEVELATDISKTAAAVRQRESSRYSTSQESGLLQAITKLDKKIDSYKLLGNGNADLRKIVSKLEPKKRDNFRQLKVVVGWSLPEGNEQQLSSIFPDKKGLAGFREEVKKTHTAILLNLADYNVDFTQEGPTTLKLKYLGSSDNYLAKEKSDIFGSNNFKAKIMFKDTRVSLEGILQQNNILTDSQTDSKTTKSKAGINPNKIVEQDPYLKAVSKATREDRDVFGERSAVVQLAGLKLAQELVTLELKREEAKQTDPEDPIFKKLRRRGQMLVLLYQRALNIRLRDMYSTFLDQMLDSQMVKVALVDLVKNSAGDYSIKVSTDPKNVATRQTVKKSIQKAERVVEELKKKKGFLGSALRFLEKSNNKKDNSKDNSPSPSEDNKSFDIYYLFLGDILRLMMRNADLRDDITFLLGNFEDINENIYSIYKIPITLESFGEFFYNRIVSQKLTSYPYRTFMNDFLNYTARLMNQNPQTSERISFDYTVFPSTYRQIETGPDRILSRQHIKNIRQRFQDPLTNTFQRAKYENYYAIYVKKTSFGKRTGNYEDDKKDGIFHYMVGSDRGLAKKFNFSRQETQYFQEMLIESNNPSDKIQALFLPQNVDIEMYGNGIHRNGDLIFVDTRAALGDFASQILGIGGYYRVVRSSHQITNRGYNTTLSCVFELRAGRKK